MVRTSDAATHAGLHRVHGICGHVDGAVERDGQRRRAAHERRQQRFVDMAICREHAEDDAVCPNLLRYADVVPHDVELVAELGAAFLCADLGITLDDREDHAAYIGSWLKVLRDDSRAIFTAAAHAQRAADFLHGLQPLIDRDDANEVAQ